MSLHLGGVYQTGADALDIGVSDSEIVTNQAGTFVILSSGAAGGLSVYRLLPDGGLALHDMQVFPDALQAGLMPNVAMAEIDGAPVLFVGGTADHAFGYSLQPDGGIGALQMVEWHAMADAAGANAPGALQAWGQISAQTGMGFHAPIATDNLIAAHNLSMPSVDYVLSLDGSSGELFSHSVWSGTIYTQVASLGAADGLALSNPTAMEIANLGGAAYAIIASATGSSLSVIKVGPDGSLTPTQQLVDTASTRFANVQDLALVQEGDHVFVLAVGADHGVSLFRMMPDGHLVFTEAFNDDMGGSLNTPSTITASIQNGVLHAFIGTQHTSAMVHLQAGHANLGQVASSSSNGADLLTGGSGDDILMACSDGDTLIGGAGQDILSSGAGQSTLSGGMGNDLFVIRANSTRVTITDFQPGSDRLDMSDLPMLRNLGQLAITSTPTGATISFRDTEIILTAFNTAPLSLQDIFPNGLYGPDSMFIVAGETEPVPSPLPPGLSLLGTNTHDSILGGEGNDTIRAGRGNDTVRGGDGDDLIYGDNGHNRLWGGNGNDTIHGGPRNDMIGGGPGNDLLFGGDGNDTIYGGSGDDTIHGEGGDTRLWGMGGNDLIYGSTLGGRIGGGGGDDTIYGGPGNDTIYGGAIEGNDYVDGGAGDDEIWGMDGNDTLIGGAGNDFIGGGRGDDRIHGGPGDDTVRGGPGADTFVFLDGEETLLVEDFAYADADILELDSALWGGGLTASQVVSIYGAVTPAGLVLDFGTGDVVTLAGLSDLPMLADYIQIV